MFIIPLSTYFGVRSLFDPGNRERDMWAAIAALVSVWLLILVIVVWKYRDDFRAVFIDGTGDVPYDPAQ